MVTNRNWTGQERRPKEIWVSCWGSQLRWENLFTGQFCVIFSPNESVARGKPFLKESQNKLRLQFITGLTGDAEKQVDRMCIFGLHGKCCVWRKTFNLPQTELMIAVMKHDGKGSKSESKEDGWRFLCLCDSICSHWETSQNSWIYTKINYTVELY